MRLQCLRAYNKRFFKQGTYFFLLGAPYFSFVSSWNTINTAHLSKILIHEHSCDIYNPYIVYYIFQKAAITVWTFGLEVGDVVLMWISDLRKVLLFHILFVSKRTLWVSFFLARKSAWKLWSAALIRCEDLLFKYLFAILSCCSKVIREKYIYESHKFATWAGSRPAATTLSHKGVFLHNGKALHVFSITVSVAHARHDARQYSQCP